MITRSILILTLLTLASVSQLAAQGRYHSPNLRASESKALIRASNKQLVSDTLEGWDVDWRNKLNGSQAAYSNWSQGGVNTISVTASTIFNLRYRKNRFAYLLTTNLKYGRARIEGEGTRKTDDRISVTNKFNHQLEDPRFNLFGTLGFNTQFDKGFNYDTDPEILISKFFAPAYFNQVAGIGYVPTDYFNAEAGLALKETIVVDTTLSTRYGLDPGDTFRFEPGYSIILNFEKNILSNVKLISSVETFTNLKRHIDNTDVNFYNELIGEINNYLSTSLQFVLIYDSDFSRQVQLKQVLSVGFTFNLM